MAFWKSDPGKALILVLLSVALWLLPMGRWDLAGPDECRYVQASRELRDSGSWYVLTVHGQPYNEKPPLPFWIFRGVLALTGGEINTWALRLPGAIAGMALVLLTFLIGRRLLGSQAGFLAGLMVLTTPIVLEEVPTAKLDTMFAMWATLAVFAWLTRPEGAHLSWPRAVLMWFSVAAAILTKGPLALVIILGLLACDGWRLRAPRSVLKHSRALVGLLLVAALVGGWLWFQGRSAGGSFVKRQVLDETLDRLLHGAHDEPFWYYFVNLIPAIMFPWAALLVPIGIVLWRERRDLPPAVTSLLGWFFPAFVLLCLANGKRQTYMIPLIPPLTLLIAWRLDAWIGAGASYPKVSRWTGRLAGVLATVFLVAGVVMFFRRDLAWSHQVYIQTTEAVLVLAMGLVCAVLWRLLSRSSGDLQRLFHVVVTLMFLAGFARLGILYPAQNLAETSRSFSHQMDHFLQDLGYTETVGALDHADKPEYHVYGSYTIRPIPEEDENLEGASRWPEIVVARDKDLEDYEAVLNDAGYRNVWEGVSAEDRLVLLRRRSPDAGKSEKPWRFRFALVGDVGTGRPPISLPREMAKAHERIPFEAVFLLGDNLDDGLPFDQAIDDNVLTPYSQIIEAGVPFHAILGNHDYSNDFAEAEVCCPIFGMNGRRYYTVEYGGGLITFFCLDSETLSHDPEQAEWFRNRLSSCDSVWRVLLVHRPVFASDKAHGSDMACRRVLVPILEAAGGVDAVFSGHNHFYERLEHRGVPFITNGTGGNVDEGPWPENRTRRAQWDAGHCFVSLSANPHELHIEALGEESETIDLVTLLKSSLVANSEEDTAVGSEVQRGRKQTERTVETPSQTHQEFSR